MGLRTRSIRDILRSVFTAPVYVVYCAVCTRYIRRGYVHAYLGYVHASSRTAYLEVAVLVDKDVSGLEVE